METYVVSALRYRPQNFEEVLEQQHITQTLENAIEKINQDGQNVGNSPAWPTGDAGF